MDSGAPGFAPIRVLSATVRNGDVRGDLVGDPTGGVFDQIFLKVVLAGAVKVVGETKEHVNAGALNIRIHHRNTVTHGGQRSRNIRTRLAFTCSATK